MRRLPRGAGLGLLALAACSACLVVPLLAGVVAAAGLGALGAGRLSLILVAVAAVTGSVLVYARRRRRCSTPRPGG